MKITKKATPQFDPLERYYTTDEAAKLLGLHPETVKKKCAAGLILAAKPAKVYRIPQSALTAFLNGKPA